MTGTRIFVGAGIFDGFQRHTDAALVIENGLVKAIANEKNMPPDADTTMLTGGLIVPGFVDLQVNGGGGLLFNDNPTVETIATICSAHARFGTTGLMVTLITDTPQNTARAIEAGVDAAKRAVPGFLGLHLEGPHLSQARKGAHDPALIRNMSDVDLAFLLAAGERLPQLLVTVAPEAVTSRQIERLTDAGIVVSLGHSDCRFDTAIPAVEAGARSVTHLFNAMSPLTHREPGLAGAALRCGSLYAGLIADGHHVHPEAITIALRAKNGPGKIYLVTDAMATIGSDLTSFTLNGRTIRRSGGRLTLEDGTLAGADLDMLSAVTFMAETIRVGYEEAVRMATVYPAQCLGIDRRVGHLGPGARADFVHIDGNNRIAGTWIGGRAAGNSSPDSAM